MLSGRADRLAVVFCLLFTALSCAWISEIGINTDEALFAGGIYRPYNAGISLLGKERALMLMTYVGALKSHLWKPILRNIGTSPATVRVPAVLLGAISIWLFYLLAKRTAGVKTAVIATALLAADTTYILTVRWDWGPVAIQHVCLLGGALAIVRFAQEPSRTSSLALGCFLFGLGMWDKAISVWTLSGLAVAALIVFPRRILQLLSVRTIAIAGIGFVVGAAPLIYYNVTHQFATFQQNASWSWNEDVRMKAVHLATTFKNAGMLGSVVRVTADNLVREPDSTAKRVWIVATEFAGAPRENLYPILMVVAVFGFPFTLGSPAGKVFLFSAIFCAIAWLQMAYTPTAGASPHHTVLLWPFPHFAIAAVLWNLASRLGKFAVPAATAVTTIACLSSIALLGTYYTNMLRHGGTKEWTDAIYPAAEALPSMNPSYVCILDWGLHDNIRLLTSGRVPMCEAVDPIADPVASQRQMAIPDVVYITHTQPNLVIPDRTRNFLTAAARQGYQLTVHRIFNDYNGRPIIDVFKLKRP